MFVESRLVNSHKLNGTSGFEFDGLVLFAQRFFVSLGKRREKEDKREREREAKMKQENEGRVERKEQGLIEPEETHEKKKRKMSLQKIGKHKKKNVKKFAKNKRKRKNDKRKKAKTLRTTP